MSDGEPMFVTGSKPCTGCGACVSGCPRHALKFETNKHGEIVPAVISDLCVNCNRCRRICPQLAFEMNDYADYPKEVYAGWSLRAEDHERSSSGGLAAVLSREIVARGGSVFGCAVVDGEAITIEAKEETDLDLLRGSKYVLSKNKDSFEAIKNKLNDGEQVLYIATPCQIAGLRSYLGKKYESLYCVDLICHGTPSPAFLREHLENKVNGEWDSFSFRGGDGDFRLRAYRNHNILYDVDSSDDEYYAAFLAGLSYRDCCYSCKFSSPARVGDITIGDFWGLNEEDLQKSPPCKVSLILLNNSKGHDLLESCAKELYTERRTHKEAFNDEQRNLREPTKKPIYKDLFDSATSVFGFDRAVRLTPMWIRLRLRSLKRKLGL